jgi:hypothetical protein
MAVGKRANPHVPPRRWNRKAADAAECISITDSRPVRPYIGKRVTCLNPRYPRYCVGDIAQGGGTQGLLGVFVGSR